MYTQACLLLSYLILTEGANSHPAQLHTSTDGRGLVEISDTTGCILSLHFPAVLVPETTRHWDTLRVEISKINPCIDINGDDGADVGIAQHTPTIDGHPVSIFSKRDSGLLQCKLARSMFRSSRIKGKEGAPPFFAEYTYWRRAPEFDAKTTRVPSDKERACNVLIQRSLQLYDLLQMKHVISGFGRLRFLGSPLESH